MESQLTAIDFTDFYTIGYIFLFLSGIIFVRYLVASGLYHLFFFEFLKKTFEERFLRKKPLKRTQLFKEIYWSFLSGLIFAATGLLMYFLYIKGFSTIYLGISDYSIAYIPIRFFIFLLVQDAYYYWFHRWMHLPKVYKYLHLIHHKSVHSSVLTSFAFHPFETIFQAVFLPMIIMILPLHIYALTAALVIMTISATINHGGVEIYPSGKFGMWLRKWFIGATHHDFHHRKFNYNFGLYFTFWDRLMKTEFEK
jgi:Delta7-sterol 5-desaturase